MQFVYLLSVLKPGLKPWNKMSDVVTDQPSGRQPPGRWATGLVNGPCCVGKSREWKFKYQIDDIGYFWTVDLKFAFNDKNGWNLSNSFKGHAEWGHRYI